MIENDLKTFKSANIKPLKEPFMTFDIESYFETNVEDVKYSAEHIPFMISYNIVLVNENNEYEISFDKCFESDNNLPTSKTKGKGMFIITQTKNEMWIKFMIKVMQFR